MTANRPCSGKEETMLRATASACFALCLGAALATGTASAQIVLPSDPKPTCTVSASAFAGWFQSGSVTRNGIVNPADSVGFPTDNTNCDFYKWSSQMFLWLTSPSYLGVGSVFDSPVFYNVSPADGQGQRRLIANTPDLPIPIFPVRARKPEEIGETGQAGGNGVLVSQAGSLVYYGIHVNDVYAEFLTGQKAGAISATEFPTTQADLDAVERFAGQDFSDGVALTLELKTSWVDAATVGDTSRYLTITAQVPAYTRGSATLWTAAGTETRQLALVGMHVVGTVQGHPEMVWATFEHVNNAPDNTYFYTAADGTMRVVPYSGTGDWLFMPSGGSISGANVERATVDKAGNIVAASGQTIGPANIVRINPWGDAGNTASSATNNTEILSLNKDVLALLADGDFRRNYLLIGALWTRDGRIPGTGDPAPTQVGSLELANATMETYHQNLNCFSCHQGTSFGKGDLSHIYFEILPLSR